MQQSNHYCDVCGAKIPENGGLAVSNIRIEKLSGELMGRIPTVEVCGPVCYFKLFTQAAYPDLTPKTAIAELIEA